MGTQERRREERRREGEGETKRVQRDNAEEMGEKDAIRAEQTPRKKGEIEIYTQTEMQQILRGKKNASY
jgi:hypothetical protein